MHDKSLSRKLYFGTESPVQNPSDDGMKDRVLKDPTEKPNEV